jgi:hypothetical protein
VLKSGQKQTTESDALQYRGEVAGKSGKEFKLPEQREKQALVDRTQDGGESFRAKNVKKTTAVEADRKATQVDRDEIDTLFTVAHRQPPATKRPLNVRNALETNSRNALEFSSRNVFEFDGFLAKRIQ